MTLTKVSEFVRPRNLTEAFSLLEEKKARIIAGGIDVILFPTPAERLIDITALPLSGIEGGEEGVSIGATTTMTELLESPVLRGYLNGAVCEMLRQVASPLQRNLATVGGSLMIGHPWSDLITLFLVIGADVTYFDGEEHEVPIDRFYAENIHRRRVILTGINFPAVRRGTAAAFIKFSRTAFDIALLNCAALVETADGRCTAARIAVGGTPRRAKLLVRAAAELAGKPLSEEVVVQAARAAQDEAEVGDDIRASADYRRELVGVGVYRVLSRIRERLEGSA